MFASTALLTLTTLFGLAIGFAREMLLVSSWGASSQTDAFLVAMFLPEAIRMALTSGLFASAALPLWLQQPAGLEQKRWAVSQTWHIVLLGCILALMLMGFDSLWVKLIGPGLSSNAHHQAASALSTLAWSLPFILLQALLSVFHAAQQRFLLSGLGSLLFNLPGVAYLFWYRSNSSMTGLAYSFVLGSALMMLILIPFAFAHGWRPLGAKPTGSHIKALYNNLTPLLASTAASQGLTLAERIIASQLGEGAITLLNLARKLINIPLIGLLSLSQVLLSHMSKQSNLADRTLLLRTGLTWATLLSVPAAIGLFFGAAPLVTLLLPSQVSQTQLPQLIMLFSIGIAFGSWNGLFARYFYAQADTRTPLKFELTGNAVNLILAFALASVCGLSALPLAASIGVIVTTLLLIRKTPLRQQATRYIVLATAVAMFSLVIWLIYDRVVPTSIWLQLGFSTLLGIITLGALVRWLRPWRKT